MAKQISYKQAFNRGFEVFKSNFDYFILLFVLLFLFTMGESYVQSSLDPIPAAGIAAQVLIFCLNIVISMGLIRLSLDFLDGKRPHMTEIFSPANLFIKFLTASVLYAAASIAGLILLIIPGLILGIRLMFFDYFVIDKGMDGLSAVKESWKITQGLFWPLSVFVSLAILINIAGILLFGLGLIVTIPVTIVAEAFLYRELTS